MIVWNRKVTRAQQALPKHAPRVKQGLPKHAPRIQDTWLRQASGPTRTGCTQELFSFQPPQLNSLTGPEGKWQLQDPTETPQHTAHLMRAYIRKGHNARWGECIMSVLEGAIHAINTSGKRAAARPYRRRPPPTCDTGPTLDNVRARVRACVRACEDNALSHAKPMRCVPGRAVSAERMSDRATRVSFHHTCQCQEAPHTSENGLGPYVSDVPCGI